MTASVGSSQSDRLVDYFVVAAYDKTRTITRGGRRAHQCHGQIIQRFPTKDWADTKFIGKFHFYSLGSQYGPYIDQGIISASRS